FNFRRNSVFHASTGHTSLSTFAGDANLNQNLNDNPNDSPIPEPRTEIVYLPAASDNQSDDYGMIALAGTYIEEKQNNFFSSKEPRMSMTNRRGADFFGPLWLVLGGCGSPVLAAAFPNAGFGLLGVPFAFGLPVLPMPYGGGHISGCPLNPAVSVGL